MSYSGFTDLSTPGSIGPGQSVRVDATLTVASKQQNVQVYAGRKGGEVEAINRTFTAREHH